MESCRRPQPVLKSLRRRALGSLLALTVVLSLSCDSLGGGTADPGVLLPLENKNEWTAAGTAGNIESASLRILDGTGALRLVKPDDAVPFTLPMEQQSSRGLLVKWSRGLPDIQGGMRLKYPVDPGASYQHADTVGTDRTFQISVSQDSVTVPAGTYECLIYTIRADTVVATASIKPGFGPVRVSLAAERDTLLLTDTNVTR